MLNAHVNTHLAGPHLHPAVRFGPPPAVLSEATVSGARPLLANMMDICEVSYHLLMTFDISAVHENCVATG